jgi:hypothetical protein
LIENNQVIVAGGMPNLVVKTMKLMRSRRRRIAGTIFSCTLLSVHYVINGRKMAQQAYGAEEIIARIISTLGKSISSATVYRLRGEESGENKLMKRPDICAVKSEFELNKAKLRGLLEEPTCCKLGRPYLFSTAWYNALNAKIAENMSMMGFGPQLVQIFAVEVIDEFSNGLRFVPSLEW